MARLTRTEIHSIALEIDKKLVTEVLLRQEEEMKRPEIIELINTTRQNNPKIKLLNQICAHFEAKEKLNKLIDKSIKDYKAEFGDNGFSIYNNTTIGTCECLINAIIEDELKKSGLVKWKYINNSFLFELEQKIQFETLQCVIPACDMHDVILKQAQKKLGLIE
jgi:hypothetical protein